MERLHRILAALAPILLALVVAAASCGGGGGNGRDAESVGTGSAPAPTTAPILGARVAPARYPPPPGTGGAERPATAPDPLGFRRGAEALAELGFAGFFAHHFQPIAGESTLAELFAHPSYRAVLEHPELDLLVFTVRSLGPPVDLAAFDGRRETLEPRLAEEDRQLHALARQLLADPALAGKTVVLKFWESDWLLVGPSRADRHAEVAETRAFVEWMRVRQTAVERARSEMPDSPVDLLHAVEVNRVHDALPAADGGPGLLRAVHLLPRIAPDLVAYSAWDSINPARDPAALASRLGEAIDLLLDPARQLAGAAAICHAGGPCLPAEETTAGRRWSPDRLFLSEIGAPENEIGEATAAWKAEAVVTVASGRGLRAVFAWELYDTRLAWCARCDDAGSVRGGSECAAGCARWLTDPVTGRSCDQRPIPADSVCRQPGLAHPLAGRGFYLLRPDGSASGTLRGMLRGLRRDPPDRRPAIQN